MDISTKLKTIPSGLRKKGLAYYHEGLVSECIYNEIHHTFEAVVNGRYPYDVSIAFDGVDIMHTECTCPVNGLCKHSVAVMYYIQNNQMYYPDFDNGQVVEPNSTQPINRQNIFDETLMFHQSEISLQDVIAFSQNYKFHNQMIVNLYEFHREVYSIFGKLKGEISDEYLKLYINTYLQTFLHKHSSIMPIKKTLQENDDAFINNLYYESIILNKINILYDDYRNMSKIIKKVVEVLEKYRRFDILMDIYDDRFFNEISKHLKNTDVEANALKAIFKFLLERKTTTFDELLLELSKSEAKLVFEKSLTEPSNLEEALYYKKTLDIHIVYKRLNLYYDEVLQQLDSIKTVDKANFIQFIEIELNSFGMDKSLSIDDYFRLLEMLDYPFDYERNYMHFYYGHKLGFRPLSNTLTLVHKGLPNEIKKRYPKLIPEDGYETDHPYEALLLLDKTSNLEKLYIFDFNRYRQPLMILILDEDTIEQEEQFMYYNSQLYKDSFFGVETTPEIENAYLELKALLKEVRHAYQQEKIEKETNLLVERLMHELQDEVLIETHEKVDLEVILSFSNMLLYDEHIHVVHDDTLFGLKVGINHKYFVKSLDTFITLVENKQVFSYGVKLAFNHHIETFSPKAQDIINVLESSRGFSNINNHVGGLLSQKKTIELFDVLRGSHIYVHGIKLDRAYHLVHFMMEDFHVDLVLNKDGYTLNLKEALNKGAHLFIYNEMDIIINLKDNVMRRLAYKNNKQRKMVHFLLHNDQFDVGHAMPKLIQKVIPLIGDDIVVDADIKQIIENQKLEIESYFDFDDNLDMVTVLMKVFQNGKQLDDFKDYKEDITYLKYLNVSNTFGFKDFKITTQEDILVFLSADLSPFKAFGKVYQSSNIENKQIVKKIHTSVSVSLVDNMIKTHIESKSLDPKHLKKILEAYRVGKKYVLVDGNVIMLETNEMHTLNKFLEQNEIPLSKLNEHEKPIYEVFKLDDGSNDMDIQIEDRLKLIIKDITNYKHFEIENKPSMYPLLKNYQVDGLKWLHVLAKHKLGGILADEMGLGKTLQMISFLESSDFKLSMVVCPKSLIYNWAHELEKFGSNIKPVVYTGTKDVREDVFTTIKEITDKTLIIISYDTLRNDIDLFKSLELHTLILDEAQHIKTSSALKTKAVKMLLADNKFILTGTPIENSIFDLWSMFDFMMPGYLYTAHKFKKLGDKVHESDTDTMNFLIKKTKHFILRRTKNEVLKELPKKIEEILYATFDGEHKRMYDAYLLKIKNRLEDEDISKFDLLSDLTRLRQLCISPRLVYDNYREEHIKLDVIYELIKEAVASNHKVLVFSSFVKALDLLKGYFDPDEIYMLTGDTPAKLRTDMSTDFNKKQSSKKVFLISLKAGGTGLNLTGADVVIHMDPWWNLAAENQASDRAHRIGQKRSVTVYKVVMKDSIEEKIILLQNKKRDLFDQMIEHKMDIEKLDNDDYKFILS